MKMMKEVYNHRYQQIEQKKEAVKEEKVLKEEERIAQQEKQRE